MSVDKLPSFATLIDWVEGRLDDSKAAEVAQIVESRPQAQESVEWIRHFISVGADMPLIPPSSDLSDRLRDEFSRRVTPWNPRDHRDADLMFDSREHPMAAGMRRIQQTDGVHLVFATDSTRLELDLSIGADGRIDADGLASWGAAKSDDTLELVLTCNRSVKHIISCEPDGTFHLADVCAEVDEVWMSHGGETVRAAIPEGSLGR